MEKAYKPNLELKYNKLGNTGMKISALGFGGSAIGGVHSEINDDTSIRVVKAALSCGINYIDTSPWYGDGHSEVVLGKALKGVPRKDYYIGTKVGRYKPEIQKMFDFSAEKTFKSVEESLERLQLDYVDIIQVHDLEFATDLNTVLYETLPALQKIKDSGKAKFIGITGYPLETLKSVILKSPVKIDTVLSYCRCCLFDQTLGKYEEFFKEHNVGIINAAILGMGLLTNKGPPPWHPAGLEIKQACAKAAKYCRDQGTDISKLALHYALKHKVPSTHLISFAELELLEKNFDVAINGILPHEEAVLQEILQKYFLHLPVKNWEGVDVKKHREKLQTIYSTTVSKGKKV